MAEPERRYCRVALWLETVSIFRAPAHLYRLSRIAATMARSGGLAVFRERLGLRGWRNGLAKIVEFILKPFGIRGNPDMPPVARALNALGPAEVKFGQMMATRPDVVGLEMAQELRQLQDNVPAFDEDLARATVERELGESIRDSFTDFGPPIAAASIAQVHRATTSDGDDVAVKILRPGVEADFMRDIDAFSFVAKVVEKFVPNTRRLKPVAVYEHFAETTRIELDLRLEAAAASEFRENTVEDDGFRVPVIDWQRSSQRVLTMEWIDGIPIGDIAALEAAGVERKDLAKRMIQSFLLHALRDGFFHADMHQGNLCVDNSHRIVALDFGIMGRLDMLTRRFYAEILLSFLRRDYQRAAEIHREAGYLPPDQPVDSFAQALRSVAEPIFGLGATKVSMARLLGQLFTVTETFGMETQTQLILLQKTMVMVEGVARDLDPNVNMWSAAQPIVEQWVRQNLGPEAVLRDLTSAVATLSRLGPRLPKAAERLVTLADAPDREKTLNVRMQTTNKTALVMAALGGGIVGAVIISLIFQI